MVDRSDIEVMRVTRMEYDGLHAKNETLRVRVGIAESNAQWHKDRCAKMQAVVDAAKEWNEARKHSRSASERAEKHLALIEALEARDE